MSDLVTPVVIAGYGRSGTTAVMALLGTTPRVAFDRSYPFENRYLTYLTQAARLAGSSNTSPGFDGLALYDYACDRLGPMPWPKLATGHDTASLVTMSPGEWLSLLWSACSQAIRRRQPAATHYAEKVPVWLPAVTRDVLPRKVLHLVRDPRDVFLSARDFARKRATVGFGMDPSSSELEQARHTVHGLLTFAENERAERDEPDCLLVRYEDWIEQPAAFVDRLNAFLGLELTLAGDVTSHLGQHMTSANPARSVGRWREEPLPAGVQSYLESHLYEAMRDYGYPLSPETRPAQQLMLDDTMRCSSDGGLQAGPGGATVTLRGEDFWVELPPAPVEAAGVAEAWLCVRGTSGEHCALYWRRSGEGFSEQRCLVVPFRPGPHWQILRFSTAPHPLWQGQIDQLRVDLFNGPVAPHAAGEVRWLRLVA